MNSKKVSVIKPSRGLFDVNLKEVFTYKDLLFMFVKRDFVSVYKQTILGPFWVFIKPLLTSLTMTVVFSMIAKIKIEGMPPVLFYLSGLTLWNYFSNCLTGTSNTFIANQSIFGKVYFPRLIIPISICISGLIRIALQLVLFFIFWLYYWNTRDDVIPNAVAFLLPVLIFLLAGLSLGFGIIFSSITTKYRDFTFLLGFGIQLGMYATPIIYPTSQVPESLQWIVKYNPIAPIIETFKHGFLNAEKFPFSPFGLLYSFGFMVVVLFVGILLFNKVEQKFMDTV